MNTSIEILDNVDRESMRSYNYIGETNVPDSTSGTSDFDENDDDPEDCFCESGDVARKGVVTKVDNIGFDTLYHGDTNELPMTLELTKPFFLTPSIGMASIFCGRPTDEDLHKLMVQYKIASPNTNRQYKEWNDPKVLAMKEPLKQITVIIEGAPEIDKPINMTKSGFIYVLKLTPEYKELLYKSSAMSPNEYFIPEGSTIKFSEKIPVTLNVRIIGRPRPQSWGPLTNPNKYNTKGEIPVNESYEPLSEFDQYFQEGYSKKQEHRVEKFLKENKFEEDPSKTTDEEKRKGYRRGTIETDILDENGKKKRVKFEMSPHDDEPGEIRRKADDSDYEIHMSKKAVSRKPAISNFIFKHEEGHLAFYLDKSSGKYVMEMEQIDKILTRLLHKMLTNKDEILVAHDKNLDEFFADRYAKEHSKYNKTSKLKISGEGIVGDVSTNKAIKGLQAILHDDVYTKKIFKNSINSMAMADARNDMDKKRNELKREIINYKGLINSKKHVIELAQETVNMVEHYFRTLQQYLSSYEDELIRYKNTIKIAQEDASRIIKAYADDLNNELIIAKEKGRILSKTERRRKVDKMYRDIMSNIYHRSNVYVDRDKYVSYTVGDEWGSDYQKKLKEELDSYRSDIISTRKHLEDTRKDLVGVKADLSKLKNELNYLKNESDEISKKLDKYDKMLDNKKLMYNSDEFKRCFDHAKLIANKNITNPFEHDASTMQKPKEVSQL